MLALWLSLILAPADALLAPAPPRRRLVPRAAVDLSGDGLVRKVASSGGDGTPAFAADGSVALLTYTARAASGQLLDSGEGAQYTVGDEAWIPGWDLCVRSLAVGEAAAFECAAAYAYGNAGAPPAVAPGEALEFEVRALEYRGNVRTSSSFATDTPLTPRTAGAIKAEYEARRARREAGEELAAAEALERREALAADPLGAIANLGGELSEKLKGFYFFGFFESATGETPPWYLRPMITFPAIFLGVGLAFYVLLASDAILLRGDNSPIPGQAGFSL
mmetsp:Transcript_3778/g.11180  ORF Transcript_3778/g.11180 Transcript_3778/m.11180 type:complete len:278 (-) Transcript_3778:20-853(-)